MGLSGKPNTHWKPVFSGHALAQPVLKESYTPQEVACFLNVGKNAISELSRRSEDPLPFRQARGKNYGRFVLRDELYEWTLRNCPLVADEKPQ